MIVVFFFGSFLIVVLCQALHFANNIFYLYAISVSCPASVHAFGPNPEPVLPAKGILDVDPNPNANAVPVVADTFVEEMSYNPKHAFFLKFVKI